MTEITLQEYLNIAENARPIVQYNGVKVDSVYRDNGYPNEVRYVVVTGGIGNAGKVPHTLLLMEDAEPASADVSFTMGITLIHPDGTPTQFWAHSADIRAAAAEIVKLKKRMIETAKFTIPQLSVSAPQGGGVKSTAATGTMGTERVSLIKVATSRNKGSPQLIFKIAGGNKNLYAQAKDWSELLKYLATATKDGTKPFVIADMSPGNEFGGNWDVSWKMNGEFTNIQGVVNAS